MRRLPFEKSIYSQSYETGKDKRTTKKVKQVIKYPQNRHRKNPETEGTVLVVRL